MTGANKKSVFRNGTLFATILILGMFVSLISITIAHAGAQGGDNASTYIYLECESNNQEILPSKMVTFEIQVRNLGDENIIYYPPSPASFKLLPDWSITFYPALEVTIGPNRYQTMFVNLTAASNANADTDIDLEIAGSANIMDYVIIPAELQAHVSQAFDTRISTQDKFIFSSPVEQQNLVIRVDNFGNGDDRITLELTGIPNGLSLSAEAKDIIIGQGKTEYFTITMFPSSNLTAGSYDLNLSLYRITDQREWVSSKNIAIVIQYYPDLSLSYGDIEISKYIPVVGEDVSINVTIHNFGDSDARDFNLTITPITRHGSKVEVKKITQTIDFLGLGESTTIQLPWSPDSAAIDKLSVELDPDQQVGELNETNNNAEYHIFILDISNPRQDSTEPDISTFSILQVSAVALFALIGGISVATILTTEYSKFALFKLILPFYTRVKKEEVLEHGVRERVYDHVQRNPGDHFRAILTKLGLTNGTLIHHLHTLERQNFIKSERDGPFKRFYPTGRNLTENILEINGIQMKIIDAVNVNPGITQKELAAILDTSASNINYHVKALQMVRLLTLKRDGKNMRCFPGKSVNGWVRSSVA